MESQRNQEIDQNHWQKWRDGILQKLTDIQIHIELHVWYSQDSHDDFNDEIHPHDSCQAASFIQYPISHWKDEHFRRIEQHSVGTDSPD